MFNMEDAIYIANKLGVTFDKFSLEDFLTGLNIELEHGYVNPNTNVTNDNLELNKFCNKCRKTTKHKEKK